MENSVQILKTIPYSEFYMWDVKRYNYVFNSSFENAISLRDILTPFKQSVSKEELIKNNWSIIKKINFQGELFLRNISDIYSYKGNVNKVPDNSIIYSKINVRHGCVYYHEKGQTPFAVSSEYPTFTFDEKSVDGYYLKRVLRSNEFKKLLNTKTSGISKARVKVDEFLNIQIPLPPLEEQNRIVTNYNDKIQLAQEQEQKAKQLEQQIEDYLFEVLEIKKNTKPKRLKVFRTIGFKEVDRWAVDSLGRVAKIEERFKGKYPLVKFRELINSYQYGLSEKSSIEKIGYPMLRMNNINNSELDLKKLKYISIVEKKFKKYKLNYGDLLFNRTNSKELVGKTAIFDTNNDFTFASYLIRVIVNIEKTDIHFINHLFNSTILGYQKNLVSRQITGQANINAQEMQEFLFPLPPLKIQKQIANHISGLKQQIKELQNQAKENREKAIQEFEEEIFTQN